MDDNIFPLTELDHGVTVEPNFGHANLYSLSPAARRKRAARKNEQARRWAKAKAVRANWASERFEEEEERIAAEIADWEAQRDAA